MKNEEKIKILISPKPYRDNDYIKNVVDCLKEKYEIIYKYKSFILCALFADYKYIYLNWIENMYREENMKNKIKRVLYSLMFFYIKHIKKRKIIWTFHNRIPHNIKNYKSEIKARKFMKKIIEKYSDVIITHSRYAVDLLNKNYKVSSDKLLLLPHGSYKKNVNFNIKKNESKNINFFFFGQISPYKNVEKIIDVFKNLRSNFYIFGNADNKYKDYLLEKYASFDNIKFEFGFIENEALPEIFSRMDILILNYDEKSFLHSGTAFLSFTLRTPIIAKKIGMFNDFEGKEFVFLYEKDEDLFNLIVYIENSISKSEIIELGEKAYKYVSENDWDKFLLYFSKKVK